MTINQPNAFDKRLHKNFKYVPQHATLQLQQYSEKSASSVDTGGPPWFRVYPTYWFKCTET